MLTKITTMPSRQLRTASLGLRYLSAAGMSSVKQTYVMTPATAASAACSTYSESSGEKGTPMSSAVSGSHAPLSSVHFRATRGRTPAPSSGAATAMPSGTLCAAMANMSGTPTCRPPRQLRKTARPSGALCAARPTAVYTPVSSSDLSRRRPPAPPAPSASPSSPPPSSTPMCRSSASIVAASGSGTSHSSAEKSSAPTKNHACASRKPISIVASRSRSENDTNR
mmetsp:Transcript_24915/g.60721  ORF Transcript_24915/g.60721 Transcript_24915/m.60721 type:complete len:225 (-) Transcript_24915:11-685(-)